MEHEIGTDEPGTAGNDDGHYVFLHSCEFLHQNGFFASLLCM
jgi:hypothetical protein